MAVIHRDASIPDNIICLPITETKRIRKHFEQGHLVILSDVRIATDFERIAAEGPAPDSNVRKLKFIFRKSVNGQPECRDASWQRFFGERLGTEPAVCSKFKSCVEQVDDQIDAVVRRIFNRHGFETHFSAWKFLRITGENLHIDNLSNLDRSAQVRLFANVDTKPRSWSVGRHWRYYAKRHFASARLQEVVDDAVELNGRLNHAAFGPSWSTCDEPRHLVEFEPGEIWLLNSALVAHQVRRGDRLCSAHYEYPYRQCIDRSQTLPAQIRALGRRHAVASILSQLTQCHPFGAGVQESPVPKIVLNPRVPNRIRVIDFKRYSNASAEDSAELTRWYENGDLIILNNYRFKSGRDVFCRVPFPNKRGSNKLILQLDEARHGEKIRKQDWQAAREAVAATDVTDEEFTAAVRAANDELMNLSDRLFPHYKYTKRFCIYNFTEMLAHNLHFDSPSHAGDYTQLRAFVNVDNFPRIWRIGGSLEEMVGNCYRSAQLEKTMSDHIRMFTRRTTLATFGDRYESGAHPYPMHSIAFQPGEVWFLNPNMLAHEVVYGRRIMDGVFLFEGSGLQDPTRYYPAMVDRMHRKHLGPVGYWWHRWKASRRAPRDYI